MRRFLVVRNVVPWMTCFRGFVGLPVEVEGEAPGGVRLGVSFGDVPGPSLEWQGTVAVLAQPVRCRGCGSEFEFLPRPNLEPLVDPDEVDGVEHDATRFAEEVTELYLPTGGAA